MGQVQGQDQGQGQGQDHLLLQHAALPPFLVLALTLTLVLVLTLALAPSGMISKKGVPEFCPSTVLLLLPLLLLVTTATVYYNYCWSQCPNSKNQPKNDHETDF